MNPEEYGSNPIQSPYGQGYGAAPVAPRAVPQRRLPDAKDRVFAILTLAASWFYARIMFRPESPIAALILTVLFYGIAFAYIRVRRIAVPKAAWWLPVSAALFSFGYLLQSFYAVHLLAFQWAKFSCLWFLAAACGTVSSLPDEGILTDSIKVGVVQPFCRFIALFPALFHSDSDRRQGRKTLGWVFLGLAVAVIPCAVVIALLSFDEGFSAMLERVFSGEWTDRLGEEFAYVVAAVPIAMYFFSSATANFDRENLGLWDAESVRARHRAMAAAPVAFGMAVMIPVLVVYCVFFASQWEQYLYAFIFKLPSAFSSYSAYARDGFFQLCAVAFVNAALMIGAQRFLKKTENGETARPIRWLQGLYAASTLALLATALAKMFLYVRYYGLTPLRVYSTWLMFAMVLAFVGTIVSLFWKKLRLVPMVFALGILFFGTLCFVDSHQMIAEYNIHAYETRQLMKLDMSAMYELGDSAVAPVYEALERGIVTKNVSLETDIHDFMCNRAEMQEEETPGLFQMTPAKIRTAAVLTAYREKYADEYAQYKENMKDYWREVSDEETGEEGE